MSTIEERLTKFKSDLTELTISEKTIVERHISYGIPFIFDGMEMQYLEIKQKIAQFHKISHEDVIMVGSAKLGFSICPSKLWEHFNDESDIDIVIIESVLFEDLWKELYNYEFNIELKVRTEEDNAKFQKFLYYLFQGWLRPDLFPFKYTRKYEWQDFYKKLSHEKYQGRPISCAIYKNRDYFYNYHIRNLQTLRGGLHDH